MLWERMYECQFSLIFMSIPGVTKLKILFQYHRLKIVSVHLIYISLIWVKFENLCPLYFLFVNPLFPLSVFILGLSFVFFFMILFGTFSCTDCFEHFIQKHTFEPAISQPEIYPVNNLIQFFCSHSFWVLGRSQFMI